MVQEHSCLSLCQSEGSAIRAKQINEINTIRCSPQVIALLTMKENAQKNTYNWTHFNIIEHKTLTSLYVVYPAQYMYSNVYIKFYQPGRPLLATKHSFPHKIIFHVQYRLSCTLLKVENDAYMSLYKYVNTSYLHIRREASFF